MSKKYSGKGKAQAKPAPEEAQRISDEQVQPDNINIDDNADGGELQDAVADCDTVKLSFREKLASLFVPVRQLKEDAAEAGMRAAEAESRIAGLEADVNEKTLRLTGLEENLIKAEALSRDTERTVEELRDKLEQSAIELEDMSMLAQCYKNDSFEVASKSFPADLQGRYQSYADMAAALAAYEAADKKPAAARPAERSLDDVLEDPSPMESNALLNHCIKLLSRERLIPANCTNWRMAIDSLRRKDLDIETLNARLASADMKVKEAENADHEAELMGCFEADTVSDRIKGVISPWLQRRINALIDNEDRRLKSVGDLEAQLRTIAEAVARPGEHDEAVADGVRSVLKPLSAHLGHDVTEIDRLAEALSQYFDERLQHEVMARFTEAGDEERRSLSALVNAANKAMADRAKIDNLLKKLATDRIEQIYERAIAYHFDDIVKKNRPDEAVDEVMEAFAKDGSFDALIRHLVKAVSTVERRRNKAQEDADIAAAEAERLDKQVKAAAEERDALVLAHDETLARMHKETELALAEKDSQRAADLARQKEELDAAHAELTAKLEEDIVSRDTDIRGLFDAYLGSVKHALQTLADDIDAAYTGNRDDNGVADVIDHNVIDNDIYGLEEFRANLLAKLDGVGELTADAVRRVVREAFADILKIESATWIDNLARLALYSQVPFIAAEFMASGVRVDRFAAAYAALESVLAQGGITLQLPRLFVDRFDESRHNAEAIKNITSIVSDVASHVPDESTVIDLFTVGYSLDGAEVRKPTVSRLNS